MTMFLGNIPDLLDKNIEDVFFQQYNAREKEWPKFIPEKTLDSDQQDYWNSAISGIGTLGEWAEGTETPMYDPEQLYDKRAYVVRYGGGIRVTSKARRFDRTGKIKQLGQALGRSAKETVELKVARMYIYSDATTYHTGGDGLALCVTNHPYSPTNATTQSNKSAGAAALSIANIRAGIQNFFDLVDSAGLPIYMGTKFDLIIPNELIYAATEILKSDLTAYTADNQVNAFLKNGMFSITPKVYNYLTDAAEWFLSVPMSEWDARLMWNMQWTPDSYIDDATKDYIWRMEAYYGIHFNDWKWIYLASSS